MQIKLDINTDELVVFSLASQSTPMRQNDLIQRNAITTQRNAKNTEQSDPMVFHAVISLIHTGTITT